MARRLIVRKIDAVGFVDSGANQHADIAIWKRQAKPEEESRALSEKTQGQSAPGLVQRVRTALGLVESELEKAAKAAESEEVQTGDKPMAEQKDQLASPEEIQEQVASLTKRAEEAEEALAAANERLAAAEAEDPVGGGEEDLMKSLPEDVRKRFEDLEKRTLEAEEIAKAERDARQTADFTKAAEEDYANLTAETEQKVEALRAIAQLPESASETLTSMLKAADAQVKASDIFKQAGREGGSDLGSGPWSKIVAKAATLVEAGKASTQEQAIAKVIAEDKELAAEYQQARASGGAE